jgi:hypothetical protein
MRVELHGILYDLWTWPALTESTAANCRGL